LDLAKNVLQTFESKLLVIRKRISEALKIVIALTNCGAI
jgi:hypothetical protein